MTAILKYFYFNVLIDIVDKYNNIYHKTIKMKPIDVKSDSFAEYLKQGIMSRFQSTKIFLLNDRFLIGVKTFFL